MEFEKLINLILAHPKEIDIHYTNINGKEDLYINGEKIEVLDKNKIDTFKTLVEKMDDCLFLEYLNKLEEETDLARFNELLEEDILNYDDSVFVAKNINRSTEIIKELILDKIEYYQNLLEQID